MQYCMPGMLVITYTHTHAEAVREELSLVLNQPPMLGCWCSLWTAVSVWWPVAPNDCVTTPTIVSLQCSTVCFLYQFKQQKMQKGAVLCWVLR